MRFRGKSIRRKIVALLLVPLVSLTLIWAFASYLTFRDARQLIANSEVFEHVATPLGGAVTAVQDERQRTLAYLADPHDAAALRDLREARGNTDTAIGELERHIDSSGAADHLGRLSTERLDSVRDGWESLSTLRRSVEDGTVTRTSALKQYTRTVLLCHELQITLVDVGDARVDREYRALVGVAQARELLSREDALVGSGIVAGRFEREELREISDLIAQRRLLFEVHLPLLPESERSRFRRYAVGADSNALIRAEAQVVDAEPGPYRGLDLERWQSSSGTLVTNMQHEGEEAQKRFERRAAPVARAIFTEAALAGVLGLLAVLVSLFLSVRIGRGLIRDLRALRQDAHEASGVRLPGVMRRLAAGEGVDVASEVPRLEYAKDEIGQVGQALNSLQRAAVEAAVKQAELRHGVSEVFVNLARRSQVLLHKQLTLLDAMERRTEDADELADLFRLDHLTTRMRRHAEGLVILSGAAPSRQWRRPVRLMDVVRAAVAEVEDYERIEVRRLPRTAVTGPAVADVTHLVAELLENATVFSPPHTTVQVHGERVANGFTLEIHDRGLGMAPEMLLDANLRLAETPEFELSDTDRLGLFVVSRLARRQHVRVHLQHSPYGGTTAVVFIPDALLTQPEEPSTGAEDDTGGVFLGGTRSESNRRSRAGRGNVRPATPPGPSELEAPVGTDELAEFTGSLIARDENPAGRRPRRPVSSVPRPDEALPQGDASGRSPGAEEGLAPLPRRGAPKLVSSHGRTVDLAPGNQGGPAAPAEGLLPRRVRQANLAPQLREGPASGGRGDAAGRRPSEGPQDRDAEEVRSRMSALQRGWQRGRVDNGEDDASAAMPPPPTRGAPPADSADTESSVHGTTPEGDGR